MKASIVTLIPSFECASLISLRNASSSVTSASSNCVTWGIITQLRARFALEIFLMRESALVSIAPNFAKSILGHESRSNGAPDPRAIAAGFERASLTNLCTSSRKMRPLRPLPLTWLRSTPSWRANFRTDGLACGFTVDSGAAEIGDGDTAPGAGAGDSRDGGDAVSCKAGALAGAVKRVSAGGPDGLAWPAGTGGLGAPSRGGGFGPGTFIGGAFRNLF